MTSTRLILLLLSALVAGCSQSSAVPNLPEPLVPDEPALPRHSAFKVTADAPDTVPLTVPKVSLSTLHATWCVAKVGDRFPEFELPLLKGAATKLSSLTGKRATVVIFWSDDRWMSQMALHDTARLVAATHDPAEVSVVGIVVGQSASEAEQVLGKAQATFPQLLDANGDALAQVGSVALPRLYVLDPAGKIAWFDIEYSESTRRELMQTLGVLTRDAE